MKANNVSNVSEREGDAPGMRVKLSLLWVFVSLNYVLCDLLSNMYAPDLKQLVDGVVGGIEVTQAFLLLAGISLEIPFAMILLSRFLRPRANRWVNVAAGAIMAVYQLASFFAGSAPTVHYIFFSVVEVACDLSIVALALRWRPDAPGSTEGSRRPS